MLEFSALISAVKPRERTDQFVILAALYYLGAEANPVLTKDVSDLLKLHLRKKFPTNVNASLSSYSAFVEKGGSFKPMRWKLTQKGLDHFRNISGLALASGSDASQFGVDVAFICALQDPEF